MNDLLAVEPNALRDSFELRYLLDKVGPYVGRYVTKLPSDWERNFCDYCDSLPAPDSLLCKELFRKYKAAFIPARKSWIKGRPWTENVQTLIKEGERFVGVIAAPDAPGPFNTLREFDWDAVPDSKDRDVRSTAKNLADAASVLIRNNSRIILVDPYFQPQKRKCSSVIRAFCSVGKGGRFARMDLVVRETVLCEKQRLTDVVKDAQSLLSAAEAPSMGIWLFPVDDSLSQRRMHERYLVAESGALEFGYGFQEFYDGTSSRLSVVGREFHQLLLELYYDEGHDFTRPAGVPPGGIRLV